MDAKHKATLRARFTASLHLGERLKVAHFIAHAQEELALLDEVERLEVENARLVAMVPTPVGRRGVDYPCEECGRMEGSVLQDGWYRCVRCGYPGK